MKEAEGINMSTLLVTNDYPPTISGISTFFYNIWKLLPEKYGLVIAPKVRGCKEYDNKSGVRTVRYPYLANSFLLAKVINLISLFLYVGFLILFKGIRKLHSGQMLSSGFLGLFLKKFCGIPYYLWVYGDETKDVYRGSFFSRYIIDRIICNADWIITISRYVTKEFLDFGTREDKIVEVLPAVDIQLFRPYDKPVKILEKYNLTGKKVILTVSRLAKRKGHETVLRALDKVVKTFPDVAYIIVGKGEEEDNLKRMTEELGLKNNVIFAGYVRDEELPDYYNLCDIFVMPNREVTESTDSIEGFGIVFLEANACGKPVVGGRSGGVVTGAIIDGMNGFLVSPLDAEELANKMLILLSDDLLSKKLGEEGLKRVREDFLWSQRAELVKKLI